VENISVGPPFVDTFTSNVAKKPLSSRFAISVVVSPEYAGTVGALQNGRVMIQARFSEKRNRNG
jgi:hypothetical protein